MSPYPDLLASFKIFAPSNNNVILFIIYKREALSPSEEGNESEAPKPMEAIPQPVESISKLNQEEIKVCFYYNYKGRYYSNTRFNE